MPKRIRQARLEKLLRERKQKLLKGLHDELFEKLGSEYGKEFERGMDSGDISFVDLMQSVGIKLVDIRQEELIKMDEAERKLRQGTYGICEECGREISEERLAALPYAVRCVEDEERYEQTKIRGRGPTM
ncbi:MAG: TraR/DksA family transcriptional regulator [Acidobacteria bacterium]|nr:TraR/DksA family transcriptional regulator [Acidobacteriota bacterium]